MADFTIEEKVVVTSWAIVHENVEESRRLFVDRFGKEAPSRQVISYWKCKLLETGSLVKDRPRSGRPVTASGDDSKQAIINVVDEDPQISTRRISDVTDITRTTVRRILKKENYHPYKPVYSHFLQDSDDDRRLQFCEVMLERFNRDPAFLRKLVFSDECVFALNGNVNKHNVHFWSPENPHQRFHNPGKTATLTVWAAIGYSGLIFYDISETTMNSERYCQILREKVVPYFQRNRDKHFQQDGAPPHYSVAARAILEDQMPGQWIGRRGPIEWPARSPDLTPCDFWLWSYLRSKVYVNDEIFKSQQVLRTKIVEEMESIPLKMFRDSLRNFQKRLTLCQDQEGHFFEE